MIITKTFLQHHLNQKKIPFTSLLNAFLSSNCDVKKVIHFQKIKGNYIVGQVVRLVSADEKDQRYYYEVTIGKKPKIIALGNVLILNETKVVVNLDDAQKDENHI
jgi:hypothetical protein